MVIVGLACLHPDSTFRPTIRKVVHILLKPNEPLMMEYLPETRPCAVYVSISSSSASNSISTTNFGSKTGSALLHYPSPIRLKSNITVRDHIYIYIYRYRYIWNEIDYTLLHSSS
jgi:hypothetical protein